MDINILIEQYDSTHGEIKVLQSKIANAILFNEGLLQSLGNGWNAFRHDARFQKYTSQIQKATKQDDEKIKQALDITKRALESRVKKLDDIKNKISSHGDAELVKKLSQAMDDNKKQAEIFLKAADDVINTITGNQQPTNNQNTSTNTQSPAPQQSTPTQTPPIPSTTPASTPSLTPTPTPTPTPQQSTPVAPQQNKQASVDKGKQTKTKANDILNKLNSDQRAKALGDANKLIASLAAQQKDPQKIIDALRKKGNFDVTDDVKHALYIATGKDTSNLKENHQVK